MRGLAAGAALALLMGSGPALAADSAPTPVDPNAAPASRPAAGPEFRATNNNRPVSGTTPKAGPPFSQVDGVWNVNTWQPVLRNTVSDADGDEADLSFEVWTTDANGNAKDRVKLTDANTYGILVSDFVTSGGTAEVTVPYGKLRPRVLYTFHTSAYDGELYETSWSPWAKFRIRSNAVDIKLPEPDKEAINPNLDDYQVPQEARRTVATAAPQGNIKGSSPVGRGENCTEIGDNKISCLEVGEPGDLTKEQQTSVERRLSGTMAAGDLVSWCGDVSGADWFKRTEACMERATPIHARHYSKLPNGQVILVGDATFASVIQMKLDLQSTTFQQEWTLLPVDFVDFEGKLSEWGPLTVIPKFSCDPQCSTSSPIWRGFPTWSTTGTDFHSAVATFTHTASGTNTSDITNVKMTWKWSTTTPDSSQELAVGDLGTSTPDLDVRCDKVADPAKPGCVFSAYKPTYVFNTKKYPAAAAHAWLMQSKLASHPGSQAAGKPMKFLPTDPAKNQHKRKPDDNRKVICPDGWAKTYGNPDATPVDASDTMSCDEYAFAASYNSGGMPASMDGLNEVITGNDCAQTYATRVKQGEWHLYDDGRVAGATWKEVCGRSSMSLWQNSGSMAAFPGTFAAAGKYHLLDKDEYWVKVPGFEHCDTSKVSVSCTYPKP